MVAGEIPRPSPRSRMKCSSRFTRRPLCPLSLLDPTFNKPTGEPRSFPIVLSRLHRRGPDPVRSEGDEVYGLNDWFTNGAGGMCASSRPIAPPSGSDIEAAIVPISALTAWQALIEKWSCKQRSHSWRLRRGGHVCRANWPLAAYCRVRHRHGVGRNIEFVRALGRPGALIIKRPNSKI